MLAHRKQITTWLLACMLLTSLIVIIGGITRLTRSGLSIVEWRPISGIIPPIYESDWQLEFEKYKQYPEYQQHNYDMTLSDYKFIFWWEFIHRVLARLVGIVLIVPYVIFLLQKKLPTNLKIHGLILLLLGGMQGALGWYMVASGLIDNPAVSHYRLAAHLSLAYLIISYLFIIILRLYSSSNRRTVIYKQQWLFHLFAALVILQIIYGAFTAGLKAGYFYNTYPLMGGNLIPDNISALSTFWANIFENKVTVQFIHRWLGTSIGVFSIVLFFMAKNNLIEKQQRIFLYLVFVGVWFQVLLGILVLILGVPVWMGVLHQAVALQILLSLIGFIRSIIRD